MTNIGNEILKYKYIIICIILLIFLLIIFFVHLYFHIRAEYFPNKIFNQEKENLFYKRLKYILILAGFLLLLIALYLINPFNIISNYFGSVILISIFIGTFIITMISWYNYAYKKDSKQLFFIEKETPPPVYYFYQSLIFVLLGGIAAGLLYLFIYLINPLSTQNNFVSFLLNVIIILIILGLVYKIFNANNNSSIFTFIIYLFSFILQFFTSIFEFFKKQISSSKNFSDNSIITGVIIMFIIFIILYLFNKIPTWKQKMNLQGGKQLINLPINLLNQNIIASYQQLTGGDTFEYQYAISFWVFLNSYPPNTNQSYESYISLLNYGGKPNILYNASKNTLMVTMNQIEIVDKSNNSLDLDANGNRIIYIKKNFLLQKWNNIIINYSGGTLDIFLNGELVKSTAGIIPYMSLDNLTVGSKDGIGGGICNLAYYNHSLTSSNIYYIYNMVKNKNPPVIDNSKETVVKLVT